MYIETLEKMSAWILEVENCENLYVRNCEIQTKRKRKPKAVS